jgi:hypothetical protein
MTRSHPSTTNVFDLTTGGQQDAPRRHDPTKQTLNTVSEAVGDVLLTGKCDLNACSHRSYQDGYNAMLMGGWDTFSMAGAILSPVLLILLCRDAVLRVLSFHFPSLYLFMTQPLGTDVRSGEKGSVVVTRDMWFNITVDELEGCWANAREFLHRLFDLASHFDSAWRLCWTDFQTLKIRSQRTRPLLSIGRVQFEFFETLLQNFIAAVTHPNATVESVTIQLTLFRMSDQDAWFTSLYSAIEREFLHTTLTKRHRVPDVIADNNPTKLPRGGEKARCHAFLSMNGCHHTADVCEYSHKSLKDASNTIKSRVKKQMTKKSLIPDPSKF